MYFYSEIPSWSLMAIKSLKTEQGREIAWPEKLGQTRDTVTVTFAPRSSPSYQLFQRNTNTPRPTVASVSQQALVGGAFKMFQPDRKAFWKCLPRKKKKSSEALLSFTWRGDGNCYHKKRLLRSSEELVLNIDTEVSCSLNSTLKNNFGFKLNIGFLSDRCAHWKCSFLLTLSAFPTSVAGFGVLRVRQTHSLKEACRMADNTDRVVAAAS